MKSIFFTFILISTSLLLFSQSGLIRHYPLDGNANDVTGSHNGTIVGGVTITSDESGTPNSALSFNGIDGFVELPPLGLNLDSLTYSICLKPKFLPASGQAYACISIGTSAADQYIFLTKDGVSGTQGWGSSSYYTPFVYPPYQLSVGSLPTAGQWYNVVLTCGKDSEILYVDGIRIAAISKIGKRLDYGSVSSMQARIGSRSGAPLGIQYFNGVIEDVKIFNRALAVSEIQSLCTGNTAINESNVNECIPGLSNTNENNRVVSLIKKDCPVNNFNIEVYDLLGQPIFQSTDIDFRWKPSSSLASGFYIYKMEGSINSQTFSQRNTFYIQ